MNLNLIAGAAASIALLLPVLLILYGRLFKNGSLLTLFFSYLFTALYCLSILNIIRLTAPLKRSVAVAINYLDAPLMLIALLFFCNTKMQRRIIFGCFFLFLLFESIIGLSFGLDVKSSVYILGPGTLLVLGFSAFFFKHYGKMSVMHGKSMGKTFMLASILFSYGCFVVIYYLHYVQHTPAVNDVFLIYYIVNFIAAVIMSIGLVWIIKRTREIEAVQLTRKELAQIFYK